MTMAIVFFVISFVWFLLGYYKEWHLFKWLGYIVLLINFIPLLPLSDWGRVGTIPPSQIVYRFDADRYLLLTGYRCEGSLYFIDEKQKVYNELFIHSARVVTVPFYHPSKNYISVPMSGVSAFDVSEDGGRTFKTARFLPGGGMGNDHSYPDEENIWAVIVANNQAFIPTKSGDLYYSGSPIGGKGVFYTSYKEFHLPHQYLRWDTVPTINSVPPIPDDYSGWDRMQCNYDMRGTPMPNRFQSLINIQQQISQIQQYLVDSLMNIVATIDKQRVN